MPVRLVVFDIAGTTVADDNAVARAFSKAFEIYGYKVEPPQVEPLMGYPKPEAIRTMLDQLGVTANDELVSDIHREFEIEMLDHYTYSPDVYPLPGAESLLLQLREMGIRIGLNTGFSHVITKSIMDRLQWLEKGLVDDVVSSDEVKSGRPHPDMIRELMRRAGVEDPAEVIKIGDTEVDIREGRNAGCLLSIGVTTGAFTRESLEPYQPDYILDSLSELPAILRDRE